MSTTVRASHTQISFISSGMYPVSRNNNEGVVSETVADFHYDDTQWPLWWNPTASHEVCPDVLTRFYVNILIIAMPLEAEIMPILMAGSFISAGAGSCTSVNIHRLLLLYILYQEHGAYGSLVLVDVQFSPEIQRCSLCLIREVSILPQYYGCHMNFGNTALLYKGRWSDEAQHQHSLWHDCSFRSLLSTTTFDQAGHLFSAMPWMRQRWTANLEISSTFRLQVVV